MVPLDDLVKVLIVDDEQVVRESLAAWFREEGCEVGTASNGQAALEKLGAADCVRFNRADGPFLGRVAWLSREASARVVPWPRDAFSVRTGADGEPVVSVPRAFGFDNRGAKREDRAATAGGGA